MESWGTHPPTSKGKKGQGKSAAKTEASEKTIGKFLGDFLTTSVP